MQRRTAFILAADIAGYSRLIASNEEDTLHRYADFRAVFEAAVTHYSGRVFNTAGDAVRAEFATAGDAVRCAADVQRALRARNASYPLAKQMQFRIGIAGGEVVDQTGDLHGEAVTVALGLEAASPPGGICVSAAIYEATADVVSETFAAMGGVKIPTMDRPVEAFAVTIGPKTAEAERASGTRIAPAPKNIVGLGAGAALIIAVAGYAVMQFNRSAPLGLQIDTKPKIAADATSASPASVKAKPPEPSNPNPSPSPAASTVSPPSAPVSVPSPPPPPPAAGSDPSPTDWPAVTARWQRLWRGCSEGDAKHTIEGCRALLDDKMLPTADQARANLLLAKALRDDRHPDEAITAYSTAIKLAPTSAAYNQRGIAYFDKSDWDRAIADYTEAIKLDANFGEAYNNRAWTKFKAGRPRDALSDAKDAVRLIDKAAFAWDTLGHIQEVLGDRDGAITSFRRALALDAATQSSSDGLKRLGAAPSL